MASSTKNRRLTEDTDNANPSLEYDLVIVEECSIRVVVPYTFQLSEANVMKRQSSGKDPGHSLLKFIEERCQFSFASCPKISRSSLALSACLKRINVRDS